MIQGMLNHEKIWHANLNDLSTSPVRCSHFTLGNQKIIFCSVFHTYIWLFTLSQKKSNCNPLAHPKWKCYNNNLWLQNFYIWLNVCCVLSKLETLKRRLWVVIGGSEKNRLWCVATGMSGKQCHSKCLEWPPSALVHTSSLFWHWSVA